ncbi:hypothetical protein K450DRAFT_253382 [Umbelopsis ramanniana AG]|uniref:Uncharacterized protein n=1 Tax=Umbelopsis ramanniana AG TaxID=1314678 RepID=A0AAD5HAQ9_UMBRA|nr:uncharacterized protein K450DRAFT_253382 [Umbelopsis ramanniana AG]KAI8577202.1 hypothetical protein K450DRAFT_253382 [Umbelopsis ramanniana AG]
MFSPANKTATNSTRVVFSVMYKVLYSPLSINQIKKSWKLQFRLALKSMLKSHPFPPIYFLLFSSYYILLLLPPLTCLFLVTFCSILEPLVLYVMDYHRSD